MAPPHVDMNRKQPLEDVNGSAEKVGMHQLPPLPRTSVPVETGTTVAGKRVLAKRRCKKLIIGIVIGAVVATAITVSIFMAFGRRHNRWRSHVEHDGHRGDEDVITEGSKRIIVIARNASNHFVRLQAVLDYNTQLAGFKDFGKNRCYVDRLRESYDEGCDKWHNYKSSPRRPRDRALRVGPLIERDVLQYIAGMEIFLLCNGGPSHWVIEVPRGGPRPNNTDIIFL